MACVRLSPQSRRCGKVLAEMGLSVDLTWKSHQSSRTGLHIGLHEGGRAVSRMVAAATWATFWPVNCIWIPCTPAFHAVLDPEWDPRRQGL